MLQMVESIELHAATVVDGAFGNIAASVDAQAQENRRPRRPLIEQVTLEIAPTENGRDKMRRLHRAIIAAASRAVASRSIAGAIPSTAGAGPWTGERCRALRYLGPLARRFARSDLRHWRNDDLRLGRFHRRCLTFEVRRRRTALLLLRLRLHLLLGRRRRRRWRRRAQAQHFKDAIGRRQLPSAIQMEQHEQQQQVDGDHRRNRAATVARADVGSVGHDHSTRRACGRCAPGA